MRKIYIYALWQDEQIIYVGQTMHPVKRMRDHRDFYGPDIAISILQTIIGSVDDARRAEAAWIWLYSHKYTLRNYQYNRRKDGPPLSELLNRLIAS